MGSDCVSLEGVLVEKVVAFIVVIDYIHHCLGIVEYIQIQI